jgi:hypothetical protein
MPETPKVLGQTDPAAATAVTLYTCGSSATIVSTITVANRSTEATSYRINIDPAGGGDSNEQYLFFDTPIGGNESHQHTLGVTLEETDLIRVYGTSGTLSFNAFGTELT